MSEQTIKAVYHEGVFQPITPSEIGLPEGQQVELSIKKIEQVTEEKIGEESEEERAARVERIMNIIDHFYDGVDESEIDEIERAIRRRVTLVGEENKAQFD